MAGTTVTMAGNLRNNLNLLRRRLEPRIESALQRAAEVLGETADNLVSKDTNALLASKSIRRVRGSGRLDIQFIVGYGRRDFLALGYKDRQRRPPFNYAVYVHQMQVPFLAMSVQEAWDKMQEAIAKEVQ